MADNYAAIRLALEGATESGRPSRFKPTPGKWVADDHQGWVHPQTDVRSVDLECKVVVVRAEFSCTVGKSEYEWANAAFVAAANPDTIRALLAERDALQAKVEAMEKDAGRYAWLRKEARIAIAGQSVIRSTLKKGTPFVEFPNWIRAADFRADPHPEYRDNFDAAIDAARAALAQPTGEKP